MSYQTSLVSFYVTSTTAIPRKNNVYSGHVLETNSVTELINHN
jgi:hypothetical protein